MENHNVIVGVFITAGIALFAAAMFLVGNQHNAFSHHVEYYTEFQNVDGLSKGAKVRVNGMDAGQLTNVQIPASPAQKFRLKMKIEHSLQGLVRDDSLVTVETEGLVGDKFLLIHSGSDGAPAAPAGSTLKSKEPFELTKMLEQAQGVVTQAGTTLGAIRDTMKDVSGRLDTTLDTATSTIRNANGIITDVRGGKGSVGLLLEDRATATDVKQSITNVRETTQKLNESTGRIDTLLQQAQSRQLVPKMDETLVNARAATQNLNQTTHRLDTTLTSAFAQDQYGEDAGSNLQQSLTNLNQASGNLSDDTEALKHEFFFKGFFKHRGYDSLDDLPVDQYRQGRLFQGMPESRQWIAAPALFTTNPQGVEELTPEGRQQIDQAVGEFKALYDRPFLIEGYASTGSPSDMLIHSRRRATLVRNYVEIHFHLLPKNIGVVPLKSTPPNDTGRTTFDGVSLVSVGDKSK